MQTPAPGGRRPFQLCRLFVAAGHRLVAARGSRLAASGRKGRPTKPQHQRKRGQCQSHCRLHFCDVRLNSGVCSGAGRGQHRLGRDAAGQPRRRRTVDVRAEEGWRQGGRRPQGGHRCAGNAAGGRHAGATGVVDARPVAGERDRGGSQPERHRQQKRDAGQKAGGEEQAHAPNLRDWRGDASHDCVERFRGPPSCHRSLTTCSARTHPVAHEPRRPHHPPADRL